MKGAAYVNPQAVGAVKFVKWMAEVGSRRDAGGEGRGARGAREEIKWSK